MKLLFLDFETFYDNKAGYDLRKMSLVEYVRDGRFEVQGVGVAFEGDKAEWASAHLGDWFTTLDWSDIAVVGHNAKFDGFILAERFKVSPARYICTKAMAKAVLGKTVKGFSLRELAEHFGFEAKGEIKTDEKRSLTAAEERELAEYCLHDVELCRQIYNKLAPSFPPGQYDVMDWTIRAFVEPKLQLNHEKLAKAAKEEGERREKIFEEIGIPKETFASNPKFAALLEERGYEVPKKKSPRTGEEIHALALGDVGFLELASQQTSPVLKKLCDARIAAKSTLLETRTTSLANIGRTGSWPFDVEFSGAAQTHRFSGGGGAGGNPQNFTRGSVLREAIESPQGYKLIVGDFSNIELRIVAYLSKDKGLIQAIEKGLDLYCDFASVFYGRKITKADKKERQFGKCAILGLGYGMGANKFRNTVRLQTGETIGEADAEKAVSLYRGRYPGVPALWDRLSHLINGLTLQSPDPTYIGLAVGFGFERLVLPSGLFIRYPNLRQTGKGRFGKPEWVYEVWKKKTVKEDVKLYGGKVLENISQALAGELCKEVLVKLKDKVVGQCHDELLLLEKTPLAAVTAARLKREMETAPSWMPEMKLAAEVHIGSNWADCK